MSKGICIAVLVAVGAFGLLAGTVAPGTARAAATGGPNPDPPPQPPPPPAPAPPPPPAPVAPPPPPPPAFVPPPPPAAVVHPKPVVHRHVAPNATPAAPRPAPVVVDRPTNGQRVTLAAGAAGSGNSSGSSGAMLLVLAGVLFAFLAIGMSRVPLTAVPTMIGSQFERNRQTILLTGLAIGFGCVAVGLFATLGGQ